MRRDKDAILDATGEECPVPVEMAAERLRSMAPGAILRVLSTDPASPIDFEAWCLRGPHQFLAAEERDGVWEIALRRAG